MDKKIRAIYMGDLRCAVCGVFELNEENNRFEEMEDPEFSYSRESVFGDSDFFIFEVEVNRIKYKSKVSFLQRGVDE